MKTIKLFMALLVLQIASSNIYAVKLHTIGDSTMADYDENTTEKRGWGMMLQQFFSSDVIVNNRAKSGASSKSFYKESPYWTTVKSQINTGDYVIIQFGHNDEKNGGLDGDTVRLTDPSADYRGTTAQGTYKTYLRAYVNETRALGATPVLVTPMCRKYFSNGKIRRNGRHDLGDSFNVPTTDHTYDYPYAMKEVADEMNVQFIDITTLTQTLFESYGDANCTKLLFTSDDSTHPNALGATLVARLCAQAMVSENILADYINASADVLVNPSTYDFGKAYVGQTLTKEFTISGFDLDPAAGTFTLSVSEGFQIAIDKTGEYGSSITMPYSNGNLDFARFYVASTSTEEGIKEGTVTINNGTVNKSVSLSASFIKLEGGTEVNVKWKLESSTDYELTGPATALDQVFSDMYVQRYAQPNSNTLTDSENWDVSRKMQRNLIEGDVWPDDEIDEVSTRYMQFGITANAETELNIDSIGLFAAAAGGNGMRCRISYSTNNFSDYSVINEFKSMVANTVYEVSAIPVVKLGYGDTLLVRVYPWYGGQATGKTICLADVCIHGMATAATAVSNDYMSEIEYFINDGKLIIENAPANCKVDIYDISGKKIYNSSTTDTDLITVSTPKTSGIYICNLTSDVSSNSFKFLIH